MESSAGLSVAVPDAHGIELANETLRAFTWVAPGRTSGGQGGEAPSSPTEHPALAVKDLFDVAGTPTGCGSRHPLVLRARTTAEAVAGLQLAGLHLVGKTAMVELAAGGWGTNRATGTPWNPWDREVHRVPGGSSSGSAVAVAARLADLGLGSDTGGSVRIPAAMCGTVGFKPAGPKISRNGMALLSPTLDTVGLLARRVAPVCRAYAELTRQPTEQAEMLALLQSQVASLRGVRIGIVPSRALAGASAEVIEAMEAAVRVLEGLQATSHPVVPPLEFAEYGERTGAIFSYEGWRQYAAHIEKFEPEMDPWVVARLRAGTQVADQDYRAWVQARLAEQQRFTKAVQSVDVVLTPTTPITAIPVADVDETRPTLASFTRIYNYLDLPALAVPAGFSSVGLPLSIQFAAAPGGEALLFRTALAYERSVEWFRVRPPLSFEGEGNRRA